MPCLDQEKVAFNMIKGIRAWLLGYKQTLPLYRHKNVMAAQRESKQRSMVSISLQMPNFMDATEDSIHCAAVLQWIVKAEKAGSLKPAALFSHPGQVCPSFPGTIFCAWEFLLHSKTLRHWPGIPGAHRIRPLKFQEHLPGFLCWQRCTQNQNPQAWVFLIAKVQLECCSMGLDLVSDRGPTVQDNG